MGTGQYIIIDKWPSCRAIWWDSSGVPYISNDFRACVIYKNVTGAVALSVTAATDFGMQLGVHKT